jgi:hypothetical protein
MVHVELLALSLVLVIGYLVLRTPKTSRTSQVSLAPVLHTVSVRSSLQPFDTSPYVLKDASGKPLCIAFYIRPETPEVYATQGIYYFDGRITVLRINLNEMTVSDGPNIYHAQWNDGGLTYRESMDGVVFRDITISHFYS